MTFNIINQLLLLISQDYHWCTPSKLLASTHFISSIILTLSGKLVHGAAQVGVLDVLGVSILEELTLDLDGLDHQVS